MKNKIVNLYLLIALFSFCILHPAFSADSASVNPLNVAIKGTGSGVPVGTVITWPVAINPPDDAENWLDCNGQTISQAAYPELYAVVGANVPNYQGIFLRGYGAQSHTKNNGSYVGDTSTTHSSGGLGVIQGDAIRNIYAQIPIDDDARFLVSGALQANGGNVWWDANSKDTGKYLATQGNFNASYVVPTANEIRPINTAVRYLIRAKP